MIQNLEELVGEQAVGAVQHKVTHLFRHVLLLVAKSPVMPVDCFICY